MVYGGPTGGLAARFGSSAGVFGPPRPLAGPAASEIASIPLLAVAPSCTAVTSVISGDEHESVLAAIAGRHDNFGQLRQVVHDTDVVLSTDRRMAIGGSAAAAIAWPDGTPPRVRVALRLPRHRFSIVRTVSPRGGRTPDVAIGKSWSATAVWERNGRIETRVLRASGHRGRVRRLSRAGIPAAQPQIAGAAGRMLVVWTESRAQGRVVAGAEIARDGRITRLGVLATPPAPEPFAMSPQVEMTTTGAAVISYLAYSERFALSDQGGRLWTIMRAAGGSFGTPAPVTGEGTHVLDPDISLSRAGAVLVAFNYGDPGSNVGGEEYRHAAAARGTILGGLEPFTRLSGAEDVDFNGAVDGTLSPGGDALVAWSGATGLIDSSVWTSALSATPARDGLADIRTP
jgi:hypothetical protein